MNDPVSRNFVLNASLESFSIESIVCPKFSVTHSLQTSLMHQPLIHGCDAETIVTI
jgi:hypothetical protein